jgi:hypothetical protein
MISSFRPFVFVCLLAAMALPAAAKRNAPLPPAPQAPAIVQKAVSSGVFHDSAGKSHPWEITSGHLLKWDSAPYLPAGETFTPHYWVDGQTDAAWNDDVLALQALKQHGVTDVILSAGTLGLTTVDPDAAQRTLDYLDAHGFQYGLQIADFPKEPLTGYTIEPSVFRNGSPQAGANSFRHISGLQDALYFLASSAGGGTDPLQSGQATVGPDGSATVSVQNNADGEVLLLYPRREFGPGTPESHLPNLWEGYAEYRDRLIAFFGHLKLGPGFRFFLDPLTDGIGMNGEVKYLVPTGQRFRLDFQAWLDQKYVHNMDSLNTSWGVETQFLPDFATAARVVPLWYQVKGLPELYDPDKNIGYDIANTPRINSHYWDDLEEYKLEATRGYMNAIADALKHGVADVPVIYTWTQHSPLFTNSQTQGGYDGLGMEAYAHDLDLTRDSGAYAYAQAQETPKTTWLVASATAPAPAGASVDKPALPGVPAPAGLQSDWDALEAIGARGFFAGALPTLPDTAGTHADPGGPSTNTLGWLGAYAASLHSAGGSLEFQHPAVLWYPQNLAGPQLSLRRLPGDVWWLPTYNTGQTLQLGPSLAGYVVVSPDTGVPINVLWSPDGTATSAQFALGKDVNPLVTSSSGVPLQVTHKSDTWTIPVSPIPTVVQNIAALPLAADAPDNADLEAHRLVALAVIEHVSLGTIEEDLFRIDTSMADNPLDDVPRYEELEGIIHVLEAALKPYTWVEGESSSDNTFTSIVPDSAASAGAYLSLDTSQDPPPDSAAGYIATYNFSVNGPGTYTLWLATSPSGASASPFTWQIGAGAASDATADPTAGSVYDGKFLWTNLGAVPLRIGPHTLTIHVSGRRSLDQRYALNLDALCVTRVPFQPSGAQQPLMSSWLPPAPPVDTKKRKKH